MFNNYRFKKTLIALRNTFLKSPREKLLARMPAGSVCAEIGVWKGAFSEEILKKNTPKELHLIDPWAFQGEFKDRMYGGTVAKEQSDMDGIYQDIVNRFGNREDVKIHREFSDKALEKFPNGFFDWVYIDGNHYYDFVMKDLEMSFEKVKSGGYITGDDFNWNPQENFPVKRAVMDFVKAKGITDYQIMGSQFVLKRPS